MDVVANTNKKIDANQISNQFSSPKGVICLFCRILSRGKWGVVILIKLSIEHDQIIICTGDTNTNKTLSLTPSWFSIFANGLVHAVWFPWKYFYLIKIQKIVKLVLQLLGYFIGKCIARTLDYLLKLHVCCYDSEWKGESPHCTKCRVNTW